MGGPRASTDRQRWAGKVCTNCKRELPRPHTPGEKFCPVCKPCHRVLMTYEWRAGVWQVIFRELNIWPFPRTSRLVRPERIREVFTSFGVNRLPIDTEQFEFGLQTGRGMIELELSPEQLRVLKDPPEEDLI